MSTPDSEGNRSHDERRTESDRRHNLENKKLDGIERRSGKIHRWNEIEQIRRQLRTRRRRKLKKTILTLSVVVGICFFIAVLFTYIIKKESIQALLKEFSQKIELLNN